MDVYEAGRIIGRHIAGGQVAGTILAALVTDGAITLSVRELARQTAVDYNAAWRCLQRMREMNLIEVKLVDGDRYKRYAIKPGKGLQ